MTCAAPVGTLTIPANSTRLGMRGGVHVDFTVPAGSGVVDWAFAFNPPLPGASWWLTNAAGQVLASQNPSGLPESGAWSLGSSDPHTVWFTTDYSILGLQYLSQQVGYQLRGACATSAPPGTPSSDLGLFVALAVGAGAGIWYLEHRNKPPAGQARRRVVRYASRRR